MTKLPALIALAILGFAGNAAACAADAVPDAQDVYCHWLAETNRTDAIRRGVSDMGVQLAYEDTYDQCSDMSYPDFATAAGIAMPYRMALTQADRIGACGIDRADSQDGWIVIVDCEQEFSQ
jgi:hypothetical protein